jgi:hypothetical protein
MRSVPRGDVLVQQKIEIGLKKVRSWEVERSLDASHRKNQALGTRWDNLPACA